MDTHSEGKICSQPLTTTERVGVKSLRVELPCIDVPTERDECKTLAFIVPDIQYRGGAAAMLLLCARLDGLELAHIYFSEQCFAGKR